MKRIIYSWLFCLSVMTSTVFAASDSVSSKTFKELTAIQTLMNEDKKEEAFTQANALLEKIEAGSIDEALTLQTLGSIEMVRENFPEAIEHLKASLALDKLPEGMVFNVGYMIAQLYAAEDKFDEALDFAVPWFESIEEPKDSQYIFMANIFAQTKRYEESIPYALKAIEISEKPSESWYQLLTASYFELKQYKNSVKTLQDMLNSWPQKATYWEQLASVYMILDDEWRALATLKIAFSQNVLEKEATLKSLLQLSVNRGIPEHGARLLESAFSSKLVEENEEFLKLLAMALVAAKERDKAIDAYERVAAVSESGEYWISIANIHVEKAEWKSAEAALLKGLNGKLTLDSPGKAWLLLGVSQSEQKKFKSAKKSFKKAVAFKKTESSATRWLKYSEDMERQADWIAQNQ